MSSVVITLPDGTEKQYSGPITAQAVAKEIGRRLEEAALAAKVDGVEVDLTAPIQKSCKLEIITPTSKEGLEVLRHSTAHLLAQAVKELYPGTQITIGPVIEDGFYYDIDCPTTLTVDDLPRIEAKMTEIAGRKLSVARMELPRDKAVELFSQRQEKYKVELIESFPSGEAVSAYQQGDFIDLCRGPHVPNTSKIGKFKLLSIAGAYWRGDEKNKMLQRIYGTAWPTQKELDAYLHRIEEAKKRDHRKLGPELGLFTFLPAAPSMPFYLPKGAWLYNRLVDYTRELTNQLGFTEVICPQLMSTNLFATSGHLEHYKDFMFIFESEEKSSALGLKPMNCPGHCALYKSGKHSYRELPIRYSEWTKLHRNEKGGVTHGILRTRAFSVDDGHIFCTEEQIPDEASKNIQQTLKIYEDFGFTDLELKLATRPDQFIGTVENWDKAEKALAESLRATGKKFEILEKEGAFYGPKIEFHIRDSIGRLWQCGTIQLDYGLPERFQLEYVGSDNTLKRPVIIHRAFLGSVERFMGILVEHHGGHFPFWISPVQIIVMNVADVQADYAKQVVAALKQRGLRAEEDLRNEKLSYKIREAQLQRVPLMIVLGNQEKDSQTLSVRKNNGETTNGLTLASFEKYLEPLLKPGGENH